MRTDIQGLYNEYSRSQQRDLLGDFGFFVRADYLERAGVTFGYNRTWLGGEGSGVDIEQDSIFMSGRWHLTPDWVEGRFTLRMDGHVVSNDDPLGATDDVRVFMPHVSFLNYSQTFYADLSYSKSSYGESLLTSDHLDVIQWAPTLGFGMNDQRDWLQLRAFVIEPSS